MSQNQSFEIIADTKQERANTLTHVLGVIFSFLAGIYLFMLLPEDINSLVRIGCVVYALSMLAVYTASTCYHGMKVGKVKSKLRILDHISIYLMIAGSYTPFVILYMDKINGQYLIIGIWIACILGIIFKVFFTGKLDFLSTVYYLLMGWIGMLYIKPILQNFPMTAIVLLILGGMSYTIGAFFYLYEKPYYHHAIWHLFGLAGTIAHFVALLSCLKIEYSIG